MFDPPYIVKDCDWRYNLAWNIYYPLLTVKHFNDATARDDRIHARHGLDFKTWPWNARGQLRCGRSFTWRWHTHLCDDDVHVGTADD